MAKDLHKGRLQGHSLYSAGKTSLGNLIQFLQSKHGGHSWSQCWNAAHLCCSPRTLTILLWIGLPWASWYRPCTFPWSLNPVKPYKNNPSLLVCSSSTLSTAYKIASVQAARPATASVKQKEGRWPCILAQEIPLFQTSLCISSYGSSKPSAL